VAEEARETLALDQVLFVPSATPPHKLARAVAPAADRLAMVRLAVAGNPHFDVSTIETERAGRSYTIDTLRLLGERMPEARLVLLIGLDAFRDIGTWKEYRSLFGLADLAVMSRPGGLRRSLRALLPVAARRDFCYRASGKVLLHDTGKTIIALDVTALDVSASDIRLRLQRGQSIRYLVPSAVGRYLERRRLYRGRSAKS
jgi:nicotinate-nucleotide adenylyltransferase